MLSATRDVWNYIPAEILVYIFSFLPVRGRLAASHVCKHWDAVVCTGPVWTFTEINFNSEDEEDERYNRLLRLQLFLGHIRRLKVVLDLSLELNRKCVINFLDMMAWKSRKLQALIIVCFGKSPFFYSGQDLLRSVWGLCQGTDKMDLQYIDLRKMPFTLDNKIIAMIACSSPNLRTLFINSRAPGVIILRQEPVVEVLRACPKLSTLGISYTSLSKDVFQELGNPNRGPFKCLELFYEGLDTDIPEELWIKLRERHPQLRVELEFAPTVTTRKMLEILKPSVPIFVLQFNTFTHAPDLVRLITKSYSRTLEKLVLYTAPSALLNSLLVEIAKACTRLKEIHCNCVVSPDVISAFLRHCPGLRRYTLSPLVLFRDAPMTVVR
ncbi:F-box/LRR-repeat protein 8-like [Elgaria multicarinata webbii]|uniref:F-box/LRR-repeat protein 8-like n=1 Tax=Elgaria multicarinata webbii TaxID=159646 RepID=UPI002FCCE416